MSKIDLSVVIVSWNTRELLGRCLESVYEFTGGINFEVIVVDNGSKDGSVGIVRRKFPQAKILENEKNLGFAVANNQGAKEAKGRYILLLNSDTELKENAFAKMIGFMDANERVGILGPQLLKKNGSVQPSGGNFPSLAGIFCQQALPLHIVPGVSRWLPVLKVGRGDFYVGSHEVDWVEGSCFLVRREVWEKLEGLDEKMFMYVEEVEFCYRARLLGWQTYYLADARVCHLGQGSSVSGRRGPVLGTYRGLKYYFGKHKPGWQMPVAVGLLKLGAVLRMPLSREVYRGAYRSV